MSRGQLPSRIQRGDVVWVDDPFAFAGQNEDTSESDHPYVVISTDTHPFHGDEYLAMLITTTQRGDAIAIPDERWEFGSLPKSSHVNPWTVVTLKDDDLADYQGVLESSVVDEAVAQLPQYIGLDI